MKLTEKIIKMNEKLQNTIEDFETFGISEKLVREDGETIPVVSSGKEAYISLFPDTKKVQYSFFELKSIRHSNDILEISEAEMSMYFWARLDIILKDFDFDYRFIHIEKIIEILRFFEAKNIRTVYNDVFSNYSLYSTQKQMFLYPFFAVRFDFDLNFFNCI